MVQILKNKKVKIIICMLSTVSFNEGQSVPGIAHGVVIEHRKQ